VEACRKAALHCQAKDYPIEKLAMQYATSLDKITSVIFSTTKAENLRRNIEYASEPIDWQLVEEVRDIIGDQKRVSWKNT
jgi:aryl-alcohol dehydrogenase-like predicted oxidoreductase